MPHLFRPNSGFPIPSYGTGYARHAGESLFPGLWRDKVGHWVTCLGPTGSVVRDLSPYKNDGTVIDMELATDWQPSDMGWVLDMDGTTELIRITDPPGGELDFGTDGFSVACWFKVAGATSNKFMVKTLGGGNPGWEFQTQSDDAKLRIRDSLVSSPVWADKTDGIWHFLVGIDDRSTGLLELYGDAQRIGSGTNIAGHSGVDSTANLEIGDGIGSVADCRIYHRILSLPEIQLLYAIPFADLILKPQVLVGVTAAPATRRIFTVN